MQGNDISAFAPTGQGVVFDGLLASPPEGPRSILEKIHRNNKNWEAVIRQWTPNEMPLKALSDTVNRLGVGADIYTFIHEDAAPVIEAWLARKGISVPVYYYESPQLLEYDLRFNRAIRFIYTSDEEVAQVLGVRATVTAPDRAWTL